MYIRSICRLPARTYAWIGSRHRLTPSSPLLRNIATVVTRFRRFEPQFGFARDPVFVLEGAAGGRDRGAVDSGEVGVVKSLTELEVASEIDVGEFREALGASGDAMDIAGVHEKYDHEYTGHCVEVPVETTVR